VWDGWRGLAILLVMIGHFTHSSWISEERMGVDIFFVLSGMLMSIILFEKKMSLRDFYIRRFSRVFPALFVFVCVAYSTAWYVGTHFEGVEILTSLFFIRTYYPADPNIVESLVPIGHLWSLNVEEHAYILMSLMTLMFVSRKVIAYWLLAIYIAATMATFYYFQSPEYNNNLILFRTETAISFIAFSAGYGMLVRKYNVQFPCYLSPLCLLGAATTYVSGVPSWIGVVFSPVLLGISINHIMESPPAYKKLLNIQWLRWLGLLSYSIYLWQQIFYRFSYAIPFGAFTGFILAIAMGVASFYLLENPLRKYINHRWSRVPAFRNES
jgi:peptidoglycan/LPS O-acetylase OafA/YrhL